MSTAYINNRKTQYLEAVLITVVLLVYITRRFLQANGVLNAVFPLFTGALLLLLAWLLFHLVSYPRIAAKQWDWRSLSTAVVGILLVFTALRVNSIYKPRDLLADAIGVGIVFGLLELLSGSQRLLWKALVKPQEKIYRLIAFLPPLIFTGLLLWLALTVNLPSPLWTGGTKAFLYWGGSVLVTWMLQDFLRLQLIPEFKRSGNPAFPIYFLGAIAIWLLGDLLIWLPAVAFRLNRLQLYGTLLLISLGASLLITAIGEIFFAEQARLRRQVSVTAAELAQLRSQVSPHFLFNALNSLYTAAWKEKSEKTADGIQRLGDMMRFMLQENNQEWIALDKELAYLHNYIHIQRIRIDESRGIDIRIHIEQQEREAVIAPMMLVPFVENAFKHGFSHLNPSWIWVTLSFDATGLYLKVQNSCHSRKETNPGQEHSGIGLDNVKRRLELIYPGKHILAITKTAKDYVAELTLILW